jgi:hypothetical protein
LPHSRPLTLTLSPVGPVGGEGTWDDACRLSVPFA